MSKFAIAIPDGAGSVSGFIKQCQERYKKAPNQTLEVGFRLPEDGGSEQDTVAALLCRTEFSAE